MRKGFIHFKFFITILNMITFVKPYPQEIEELKREIDEDQSGEIEFHEFLEIMNSKTLRFFLDFQKLGLT